MNRDFLMNKKNTSHNLDNFHHKSIWDGIDNLAAHHGLSVSALARKAGLDPTIFNKSKRVSAHQKLHWPSTESLMRVLETTECSFGYFVEMMTQDMPVKDNYTIPLIDGKDITTLDSYGFPAQDNTKTITLPFAYDKDNFAYKPSPEDEEVFRLHQNNILLVCPHSRFYPEDIVLIKTKEKKRPDIRRLKKMTTYHIESSPLFEKKTLLQSSGKDISWAFKISAILFFQHDKQMPIAKFMIVQD